MINQLTPWGKFHVQKLRPGHLFEGFLALYGTQILLPHTQEAVTSHCGLPDESNSKLPLRKHLQYLSFDQCEKPSFIPIKRGTIRILYISVFAFLNSRSDSDWFCAERCDSSANWFCAERRDSSANLSLPFIFSWL